MEVDLRALQERGRFFWEIFPGATVADNWQRQREEIERKEKTVDDRDEEKARDRK